MTSFLLFAAVLAAAGLGLLLMRTAPAGTADDAAATPSRRLSFGLAILVLAVTAIGYAWVGSPRLIPVTPEAVRPGAPAPEAAAATDGIADTLRERAQAHAQDALAQFEWARAELDRGRPQAAAEAYRRAVALRPKDPDLLADGADVLAVANGGRLAGEPMQWVQRALAINPDQLKALALKGNDAALRHDFAGALAAWDHALKVAPPDDPIAEYLKRQEIAVRELAGQPAPARDAAAEAAPSASSVPASGER